MAVAANEEQFQLILSLDDTDVDISFHSAVN